MKRIWILLAMAFAIATASIPEGVAQAQSGYATSYIWPDSLKGQIINVRSILVDKNGDIFTGTCDRGLMRTTDNGRTWMQIPNNLDWWARYSYIVIREPKTNALLVGTINGLFRSTDNGISWFQPPPPSPYGPWALSNGAAISCFSIQPDGSILAGATKGIIKSEDGGLTWKTVFYDDSMLWGISSLTANPKSGAIFAGSGSYKTSILRSTDNGKTWQPSGNGIGFPDVESIAADDSGTIYAGTGNGLTGNGLYRSPDNGDNWTRVAIDTLQKEAISILVVRPNLVFVGFGWSRAGSGGVLRYDGKNWTRVTPSVINGAAIGVMSLAVKDGSLLVGTYDGLYRVDGVITAVEIEKPAVPSIFRLEQNYPNPFNPSTTIRFSLPNRAIVNLAIYNALGQKIETLVDREIESGVHRIIWNPSAISGQALPSGIYFYQLKANTFAETKKMLLVK